jgi:hypothetical protein
MKRKREFKSIHEIRIARERYRYDTILQREKLNTRAGMIFSNLSLALNNMSLNIRSRLFSYSFFRTLFKTGMLVSFARNFSRGFRQAR